jgi:hypothetical protein
MARSKSIRTERKYLRDTETSPLVFNAEIDSLRLRLAHWIKEFRRYAKWIDAFPRRDGSRLLVYRRARSTSGLSRRDIALFNLLKTQPLTNEEKASSSYLDNPTSDSETDATECGPPLNGENLSRDTD